MRTTNDWEQRVVPWTGHAPFMAPPPVWPPQIVTGEPVETPRWEWATPACMASLFLHLSVVIILGLLFFARYNALPELVTLDASPEMEPLEETPEVQHFLFDEELRPEIGSLEVLGSQIVASAAPVLSEVRELPTEEAPQVEVEAELHVAPMKQMAVARQWNDTLQVKGLTGVGAVGTVGAVDRITREILTSLEQRRTLVVWLFDKSLSMQAQREAVNARFNRIYEELGASDLVGARTPDAPLLTSIVAFGEKIEFMTQEPTDDLVAIQSAIASIGNDLSGVEKTFSALRLAIQRYQTYRTGAVVRNVMLVVCTDEVGDDDDQLDFVIRQCQRLAMPVYVVGIPAPFGRDIIEVKYVDPDPKFNQDEMWLPVRQGPETLLPEGVRLGFSGRWSIYDEMYRLDSGFGPYCLSRLCYETGGIYFAVHGGRPQTAGYVSSQDTPVMASRLNYFFDPDIMRAYTPDYMSGDEYKRLVNSNKARAAIVEAARLSMVMPMEMPRLTFEKLGEEEAPFKQALDEAQKKAAVLEPRLAGIHGVLKLGEPDRAKLTESRWQAGYDLAMGRILAVRVRTEAYNAMLAQAKNGMLFKGKTRRGETNNVWVLKPADEVSVGSTLEKMAQQSRTYLERVVREHAGTPWALLAQAELKDPIGWKWTEQYRAPPPRPGQNNNPPPVNNNNNRPRPEERPLVLPKPPAPVRSNIRL